MGFLDVGLEVKSQPKSEKSLEALTLRGWGELKGLPLGVSVLGTTHDGGGGHQLLKE